MHRASLTVGVGTQPGTALVPNGLAGGPRAPGRGVCDDSVRAATIDNTYGLRKEELGRGIYVRRHLHQPLQALWPRLRAFR